MRIRCVTRPQLRIASGLGCCSPAGVCLDRRSENSNIQRVGIQDPKGLQDAGKPIPTLSSFCAIDRESTSTRFQAFLRNSRD